jgi:hypothetical protein
MSDYSEGPVQRLAEVSVKQIEYLLSLLSTMEMRRSSFVRRAYDERAQHFSETLEFLTQLSWIEPTQHDDIRLTSTASAVCGSLSDEQLLRQAILTALMSRPSAYRMALGRYVRKFNVDGGRLKYRPSLSERLHEKPIRDLLMDLRAVEYNASNDTYEMTHSGGPLYVWAKNVARSRSHDAYDGSQKRREELGFEAELAALEYERKRVGPELAPKVEHVSAQQPFACYDIKSFTVSGSEIAERYIEVKAVSPESLQFYWSRAEIDIAQVLASRYFLYLLPYRAGAGFDAEGLRIIADPYSNVYACEDWETEEDVIICRRRGTSSFS